MLKLTRRHVITTLTSSAVLLCPAILNAQSVPEPDFGGAEDDTPVGFDSLEMLAAGPAEIDVSVLQPGEVAVVGRPSDSDTYAGTNMIQYVAVMRRTEDQIAFGTDNDRAGTVQDPNYFVVNLVCPHRGKAIGLTGNSTAPFACLDRGNRHGSIFDPAGYGIAGASEEEYLSIPDYSITSTGEQTIVALA